MLPSIKLYLNIDKLGCSETERCTLPFYFEDSVEKNGMLLNASSQPVKLKPPLSNSVYVVTPVHKESDTGDEFLVGYEISVNVPSCVMGNTGAFETYVYGYCLIAVELFKHFLLVNSCGSRIVKTIKYKHFEIIFINLTFFFDFDSKHFVKRFDAEKIDHDQLLTRMNRCSLAISKKSSGSDKSQGKESSVRQSGTCDMLLSIKDRTPDRSFDSSLPANVKKKLRTESFRKLRVDFEATEKWLISNQCQSLSFWRNQFNEYALIDTVMRDIKTGLGKHKIISMKPEGCVYDASKNPSQNVGLSAQTVRRVDDASNRKEQNECFNYQYEFRVGVDTLARISIFMSFLIDAHSVLEEASNKIETNSRYRLSKKLEDYCFSKIIFMRKLRELKYENGNLLERLQSVEEDNTLGEYEDYFDSLAEDGSFCE